MNGKTVSRLDAAAESCLLALAFALPLAAFLKAFDPTAAKAALLAVGAVVTVALWLARQLEAGRLEVPAPRAAAAGLGAALLAWTSLAQGWGASAPPAAALERAAGPALFLIVLLGPGSAGFARALAGAALWSGALCSAYALLQRAGLDPLPWAGAFGTRSFATLGSPLLLAVTAAAALPLALPGVLDPEASGGRRAAASAAAALCLAGLFAAASPVGWLALAAGAGTVLACAPRASRDRQVAGLLVAVGLAGTLSGDGAALSAALGQRLSQAGALFAVFREHPLMGSGPGTLAVKLLAGRADAALALAPLPASEPLATAAELGIVGAALWSLLILGSLSLALRDARRRLDEGEARDAALAAGHAGALGALVAAGLVSGATSSPAPGAWLWLLAGSAAALALERGSGTVRALPVPLPPKARRALLAPLAGAALLAALLPLRGLREQTRFNEAVFEERAGRAERALELYRQLAPDDLQGLQARLHEGSILLGRDGSEAAGQARDSVLTAFKAAPDFGDAAFLLAEAERRTGRWAEAERDYQFYAALAPADARPYKPLAEVRQTLGRPRDAVAAAEALVRLTPADPEAWRFLAEQVHEIDPLAARKLFAKADAVRDLATSKTEPDRQP